MICVPSKAIKLIIKNFAHALQWKPDNQALNVKLSRELKIDRSINVKWNVLKHTTLYTFRVQRERQGEKEDWNVTYISIYQSHGRRVSPVQDT